jgi:hypothetical protein
MATSLHTKGGKLLYVGGKLVYTDGCCCLTECPDVYGCGDVQIAIAGLSGTTGCLNGTYTLTQTADTETDLLYPFASDHYSWHYFGVAAGAGAGFSYILIDYGCINNQWQCLIHASSACADGTPIYTGQLHFQGHQARFEGDTCGYSGFFTHDYLSGVSVVFVYRV